MDGIVEENVTESNGTDNNSPPTQDKSKSEEKPQGNCYWYWFFVFIYLPFDWLNTPLS